MTSLRRSRFMNHCQLSLRSNCFAAIAGASEHHHLSCVGSLLPLLVKLFCKILLCWCWGLGLEQPKLICYAAFQLDGKREPVTMHSPVRSGACPRWRGSASLSSDVIRSSLPAKSQSTPMPGAMVSSARPDGSHLNSPCERTCQKTVDVLEIEGEKT